MFVLDASVVLQWFVDEPYSDKAQALRSRYVRGEIQLAVPDLLLHEVANALRYKPSFTPKLVVESINTIFDMEIDIIAPVGHLMKSAIRIAYDFDITEYDAHYLAIAKDIGYKLITADEKFYRKIESTQLAQLLSKV